MDTDLYTVARTLAERGWLPGILVDLNPEVTALFITRWGRTENATEADLHLAAHNEIDNRGWIAVRNRKFGYLAILTGGCEFEKSGSRFRFEEPGTTTLSLLRCLRRACEEHERATRQAETEGKR